MDRSKKGLIIFYYKFFKIKYMQILIYAPESSHCAIPLARMFRQCGVNADTCHEANRCRFLSMTGRYTAVVCVRHPDFTEFLEFFSAWKTEGCCSYFITLSQQVSAYERARALELGVDAYHIEPCSYSRLLIEITMHDYRGRLQERNHIVTTLFDLDIVGRNVRYRDVLLELSKTEFNLLAAFIRRRGIVLTRLQLWEDAWGDNTYPLGNTIDVHVGRLRKKLGEANLIQSVHGIGYRLRADA
jgi:DNA-binding response OmpR family regulator